MIGLRRGVATWLVTSCVAYIFLVAVAGFHQEASRGWEACRLVSILAAYAALFIGVWALWRRDKGRQRHGKGCLLRLIVSISLGGFAYVIGVFTALALGGGVMVESAMVPLLLVVPAVAVAAQPALARYLED